MRPGRDAYCARVDWVYWRPVFNILEDESRTLLLVNPQHTRAVPGKKTDVRDSEWLADLLRHSLLRASFIPPAPIRALPRSDFMYMLPLPPVRSHTPLLK